MKEFLERLKLFIFKFIEIIIALFVLIILVFYFKKITLKEIYNFIDFRTIFALISLILITTGLNNSGYFNHLVFKVLKRVKSEKELALLLIFISLIFSTFLTNDITLFAIVPFTLRLQKFIKNDVKKIIIFEAIAVNTGSMLTPIGNPQNIFLWGKFDIPFFNFICFMFPIFLISNIILFLFAGLIFKDKKLDINELKKIQVNKRLLITSFILFIGFIIGFEFNQYLITCILIIIVYFFIEKIDFFKSVNIEIVILFLILFIDIGLLAKVRYFDSIINFFINKGKTGLYFISIVISQFISNVPATLFISNFSNNFKIISFGVNIAGNGIIISSLANIIAIKLSNDKKLYFKFHLYSIPFFLITSFVIFFIIKYFY